MKRIHANFDNRDRIICISTPGFQQFYYQPVRSSERYWLFNTEFSGSVFAYFRKNGLHVCEKGFSLTLRQLYKFDDYRNPKLARVMTRIPGQVQYVIHENAPSAQEVKNLLNTKCTDSGEFYDLNGHGLAAFWYNRKRRLLLYQKRSARIALRWKGRCRLRDPPQAENPAEQDSF